jgi:hypothetical protein
MKDKEMTTTHPLQSERARFSRWGVAMALGWFLPALLFLTSCGGKGTTDSGERARPAEPAAAASPAPAQPNVLTDQEKAEGWALLWNGVDFEGWRGVGLNQIPQGHWVIEDGAIKKLASGEVARQADGQPIQGGDLLTDATYENFELRFEWKISPSGNSGVKYNVSEEMSKAFAPNHAAIGFEYQVLDDGGTYEPPLAPNQLAAGLYDLIAPGPKTLKPVGEFNESRIVFRGYHGEHWLNGAKVVEFDLGTPEMEKRVAASKFLDIPGFAKKRSGHIVLQDHGSAVWFRNIKIRPLEP